jgi:hypothetical protein
LKYRTLALVCPMSAMMLNSGYRSGSHMIMNGLISMGATTARVGCLAAKRIASSVLTWPMVMVLSSYICCETRLNPVAGPPERTSRRTPVFRSPSYSAPLTTFLLASIFRLGPSMWVEDAVLGLGEPVGLDHDRLGADAAQVAPPPPPLAAPVAGWGGGGSPPPRVQPAAAKAAASRTIMPRRSLRTCAPPNW